MSVCPSPPNSAPAGTGDTGQPDCCSDSPPTNRWDAGPVLGAFQPYIKSQGLSFCPSGDRVNPDLSANTNYEQNAFLLADHPREPVALRGVPVHEHRERGRVAIEHPAHERGTRHWYRVEPRHRG